MKVSFLLLLISFNLFHIGMAVRGYQQTINGRNYGSNDTRCYVNCQYGQSCNTNGQYVICKSVCGDGIRAGSENNLNRCDDGNNRKGDGCDQNCIVQNFYLCSGEPSVCQKTCGDGILNNGQECDDGNLRPGDGCTFECRINQAWECTTNPGQKSVCTPKCGDGKRFGIQLEARKCDDSNTRSGDGCSPTCEIERLYKCNGTPSICEYLCRNGRVNSGVGQLCDDGNNVDTDGCSNDCRINVGWVCYSNEGGISHCRRV